MGRPLRRLFPQNSPSRAQAVTLQRHARAVGALADRWSHVAASPLHALNSFVGSEDLNSDVALQLDGILFMEGEGEPAEIARMKRDLLAMSDDALATGSWLASAMQGSWDAASALFGYDELADLLGDRHRIIANDWQAAEMSSLAGRLLARAVDLLGVVDFSPAALRADLDGPRVVPGYLYSAAELVGRAADLLSDSAGLVQDNERRWRTFHNRVAMLIDDLG